MQKPETRTEEEDLNAKIRKHLDALSKHPGPISGLYTKRSLPRIFTPGRPDVGLPISLPPYLDILAAYGDESNNELQRHELDELLADEVDNLVRTILPRLKPDKHKGYVELLVRLFRHANEAAHQSRRSSWDQKPSPIGSTSTGARARTLSELSFGQGS